MLQVGTPHPNRNAQFEYINAAAHECISQEVPAVKVWQLDAEQSTAANINISSIGGVFGNSGIAYSAAKSAVLGMTKNIAIQFAGLGIRCNAVCPGPTPTALNTPDKLSTFDSFANVCAKHMDMSRPEASALDQAQAILFFASDDSAAVTGQALIVDNGTTL